MSQQGRPGARKVAILVFDGVQIIDFTGPYEVFGQAGFEVFTIAMAANPVRCEMGLTVAPARCCADDPAAEILVVPGGEIDEARQNPALIEWIRAAAGRATHVLSVCNGAFLLAEAGLLDGLSATTYYGLLDELAAFAPKTAVVADRRFVDNGQVIATAGLSSGIDGSLHLVAKMLGKASAQKVALNMEYNWQPSSTYARAAFADKYLRRIFGRELRLEAPPTANARLLGTEGGVKHWEVKWDIRGEATADETLHGLNDQLMAHGWSNEGTETPNNASYSFWSFTGENASLWNGIATLFVRGAGHYMATLKIYRTDLDTASLS